MRKRIFFHRLSSLAMTLMALLGLLATLSYSTNAGTAHAAGSTTYGNLNAVGDTAIVSASGTNQTGLTVRPESDANPQVAVTASGPSDPTLPPPPTTNPNPPGLKVTANNKDFFGFNGISHADQRNAGSGIYTNTQYSLEPPDQALCVGSGFVVEAVNNAIAVYNHSGKMLAGVEPLSQFFKVAPEIVRTANPPVHGPFVSDPRCVYDPRSNHWFLTELEIDEDPVTGAYSGPTHTFIAVSQTDDPTANWTIFSIDTTDNGTNGTPTHAGCPCYGDQPLNGVDKYGFYVSTNEFTNDNTGFNGAQLYAISKRKLIDAAKHTNGGAVTFAHINAADYLAPYGGVSYSIQPANAPSGAVNSEDLVNQARLHGIEYFMSALQFGAPPYQVLDNRIAVWALTNTQALDTDSPTPDIALHLKVIGSETYGQPVPAQQKAGPTPLRDLLAAGQYPPGCGPSTTPCTPPTANPLEQINTNDDRMNQVVFAEDSLWSGVNTLIGDGTRTGIAYFRVHPSWTSTGDLKARMANQGYVAVDGQSVYFPSVGVNAEGRGVIVFSLSGPDYYPSSAYVHIDLGGVHGSVHIAGAGVAPEDGFSGYAPFTNPPGVARWGDYSAAVGTWDGTIWAASEYIPGTPRTLLANWGTFVSKIAVDGSDFDD